MIRILNVRTAIKRLKVEEITTIFKLQYAYQIGCSLLTRFYEHTHSCDKSQCPVAQHIIENNHTFDAVGTNVK